MAGTTKYLLVALLFVKSDIHRSYIKAFNLAETQTHTTTSPAVPSCEWQGGLNCEWIEGGRGVAVVKEEEEEE